MNISYKNLENNCLSDKKKTFYTKLISRYEKAFKEYRNNNNKDGKFKSKVISWLFSHSIEERMILCSVENKKYTNTIHEAYMYTKQSKNVKFFIGGEDLNDGDDKYKLEMTTMDNNDANENTKNKSGDKKEDFWTVQNNFLDNFVFYQCESPIDDINNYSNYFTLDCKILEKSEDFKKKCNEITHDKFLASPIMIKKEIQNKTNKSLELPNWISPDSNEINNQIQNSASSSDDKNHNKKSFFSLTQIILSLIEQALSIRYVLYYKSNNLNELLESTYLYDLVKKKGQILEYLNKNNIEPKIFYTKFNIADINSKIFYDQTIERFIKEKKNYLDDLDYYGGLNCPIIDNVYNDNVKTDSYNSETFFGDLVETFKNNNSEFYKNVIEMSLFFPLNKLYTLDDFFFRSIFEKISDYYSNKMLDDLTNSETKTDKQKKKKKKKKKNNTNNENEIKEEDN
jgi:hypothetical protein